MTTHIKYTATLLILAIVAVGVFFYSQANKALGEAFTGTASNVRLATTTVVGPQGPGVVRTQIFASNAACKSRIITTDGTTAIRISFKDTPGVGNLGSTTVDATLGHLQAASTTVEYNSGIYGCGTWNVWAWASTTLTLTETQ